MTSESATAANVELWDSYLREAWDGMGLLGWSGIERLAAAGVASWFALIAGPQISWMFGVNASDVNTFLAARPAPTERRRRRVPPF